MELHTLGVDGGYTQKDVQEVARCFTGWTIRKPNDEGLAFFNPATHDTGEKIVLGQKIPAGGGVGDGEMVLNILARHPSTARFIATKLARRFISDDPPQAVVDRAAAVFLKTDGSITDTLRAILMSPEFVSRGTYRAKTRSPFEYVAAALRALNAETDADRPILTDQPYGPGPVLERLTLMDIRSSKNNAFPTGILVRLILQTPLLRSGIRNSGGSAFRFSIEGS